MNGPTHAVGSGTIMAIATYWDSRGGNSAVKPYEERIATAIAAGGLGALCGSLPDVLEPALHPNHRQFFHSVIFGIAMFECLRHVYRWRPNNDWQRLLRGVTLIAGGAYLVHLMMDATTKKSLPLFGKLP